MDKRNLRLPPGVTQTSLQQSPGGDTDAGGQGLDAIRAVGTGHAHSS